MTLYFVIGASGSGKSAASAHLKEWLKEKDAAVFDFDDIGVPPHPDAGWRQQSTERWIEKLRTLDHDVVILLGQMVPGEIVAANAARDMNNFQIILLDCDDAIRVQRLTHKDHQMHRHQSTLNWASWLRMHCVDPQWEPDVITKHGIESMHFDRWSSRKDWHGLATIHPIDTSSSNAVGTALMVLNHIKNDLVAQSSHEAFEKMADQWQHARQWGQEKPIMDECIAYLRKLGEPQACKVLDAGCGTGTPIGEYLIKHGFDVYGMDNAKAMLEHAKKVFAPGHLLCEDIRHAPMNESYHAIIAWSLLPYLHADEQPFLIEKLFQALKPRGILCVTLLNSMIEDDAMESKDEYTFTATQCNQSIYQSGLSLQENMQMLLRAGFSLMKFDYNDEGHIIAIARKHDPSL